MVLHNITSDSITPSNKWDTNSYITNGNQPHQAARMDSCSRSGMVQSSWTFPGIHAVWHQMWLTFSWCWPLHWPAVVPLAAWLWCWFSWSYSTVLAVPEQNKVRVIISDHIQGHWHSKWATNCHNQWPMLLRKLNQIWLNHHWNSLAV